VPEVLTLEEAARYLRLSEEDVLASVAEQGLPGRRIGGQWRFLKLGLADWLRGPSERERLLQQAGALKDDTHLEQMLREIYKRRGRPMTEDAE
jgi:excisionase family DNA binding protein